MSEDERTVCEHEAFDSDCNCMMCGLNIEAIKDAAKPIDGEGGEFPDHIKDAIVKAEAAAKEVKEIVDDPEASIEKDVKEAAGELGISEDLIDAGGEVVKPYWDKLPHWAKVGIGIGVAVALFLARHYDFF